MSYEGIVALCGNPLSSLYFAEEKNAPGGGLRMSVRIHLIVFDGRWERGLRLPQTSSPFV